MNILLLGGTGTLSAAVLHKSISEGHHVCIFNRGHNNKDIPKNVDIIIGNFDNRERLKDVANHNQYDVVIDFLSRRPKDIERSFLVFKDRCKQYIFISSACVYRRSPEDFPIKEQSPKPNVKWSYNIEKYECEQNLKELSKGASCYYTIIRPYITYDDNRIPLGIAPAYKYHRTIIERIKAGKPMFVWDEGKAITTVTHTNDFAKGVVGLFLNNKAENEDFHITSSFKVTGKELLEVLFKQLGRTANIVSIPSSTIMKELPQYAEMLEGDRSLDASFNNQKIKDAVKDLEFEIDVEEGISRVINNYDQLNTFDYDYAFEGQVDKLLSTQGIKTKFIQYPGAHVCSYIKYMIYKNMSYRIASKLCQIIKIK